MREILDVQLYFYTVLSFFSISGHCLPAGTRGRVQMHERCVSDGGQHPGRRQPKIPVRVRLFGDTQKDNTVGLCDRPLPPRMSVCVCWLTLLALSVTELFWPCAYIHSYNKTKVKLVHTRCSAIIVFVLPERLKNIFFGS